MTGRRNDGGARRRMIALSLSRGFLGRAFYKRVLLRFKKKKKKRKREREMFDI
jgi:hypothetical protein